jgi:hypothetical protein
MAVQPNSLGQSEIIMAAQKKITESGSGKKSQVKMRDMKPSKDAKGGARHVEGAQGRRGLIRPTKNLN